MVLCRKGSSNQITSNSYDKVGNLLTSTDELGRVTKYSYDADNRLIKTTDALNSLRSIGYDALGNILSTTDELGRTTGYIYDRLDRQTGITDALGHTSSRSYDGVGNTLATIDALGNTTQYQYDSLHRQTKVIDTKGGVTQTGYDAVGNTLSITDAVGNITSYSYDALNRQLTDTNSLGKTRSFGYDAVGDLTSEIDRNGRKRTYNYDALYRQTAEHWLDNLGTDIRTFNYSYDAVGHLLGTNDPDSKYTYTYDAVDRVTSVDNLGTAGVPNVLLNYGYDAAGNLLGVVDKINGVQKGTNAYTYDLLNRATRITQAGTGVQTKRVDMAYDAASQMTGLNRYSDILAQSLVATSLYTYDSASRLTKLEYKRGTTAINSFNYAYDAANRLTQQTSNDGTSNYSYDTTDQLTSSDHSTQTDEAYSYDSNGNRTNAGYGTGTNNQLLTDGKFNYQYDDQGNRTQSTEIATGKVTEYGWDYRNRLTSVTVKDVTGVVIKSVAYTYDVNNRRIGKVVDVDGAGMIPATTERYVYDGNQISLVFDGAGNQTHRYLYGTQIDQILADETNGTVRWAVTDRLGTVTDVIDSQGLVLNHLGYDSFGRVVSQSDAGVEFRYGYTGREFDSETGLDYYRARYYDSSNGRFIGEDPLGFGGGDGNLTRYVGNSPTNWTDPSGEIAFIPILAGVAISYIAGQAFFPQYAQAPTSPCDNHPTPPDQELKQAGVEFVTGLGVSAAPGLVRSGLQRLSRGSGNIGSSPLGGRGPNPIDPSDPKFRFGSHLGESSNRPFYPQETGLPISPRQLSNNGVRITDRGVDKVEQHLSRFDPDSRNQKQVERLRQIAADKLEPTTSDLNNYTHELRESLRYKKLGYKTGVPEDPDAALHLWNNTHTATLEEFGLREGHGVLYHPSTY